MSALIARYEAFINPHWSEVLHQLGEQPVFVRAKDEYLYDDAMTPWLDLVGHYGAAIFGHNRQELKEALYTALEADIPCVTPLGLNDLSAQLAIALIERLNLSGPWRLSTLTTGTEAVEGAIKAALIHTGRSRLLVRRGCFHGSSSLAMHLTDNALWRQGFEALPCPLDVVYFDDIHQATRELASGTFAAMLIEPFQAIGGGVRCSAQEAEQLLDACTASGTVSICDEIFSGLGRCGHYSAMQALGWTVRPDILLLSKSLTGAFFPSAHVLMRAPIADSIFGRPGCQKILGSTFANNALGFSVALTALGLLDRCLADSLAGQLRSDFVQALHGVAETVDPPLQVQALGACIIVEFCDAQTCFFVWHSLFANQILTTVCSNKPSCLKVLPSLTMHADSYSRFIDVFTAVVAEC
ncbi:aminotransferase class III-fold pyridoxal phosphate-dependent enzyme [Pseudomonas sp. BCA14]|uniref:aminotransferase class III-fold pyridoxal phosphate-dependent enzyme n=1 Tax=unclassified Pseudomonas TaxID=196821 RepID=UPI00106E477F|nr:MULTISPECIES: aminotransferase class III-fold pyridoxal phosphate-dependent enzyme [unclassified Pseudomonas]TFF07231.1 aminotransferase class III-fold pyridoxal phosphate-dependent enzyme [Pseudomonas sp. JMN1]TFF10792.1 aminotransferase class III-fold pyridoxal phosphate-dependent enzyme [Pseudomonas sp. BCA17]TFF23479.1 aminotransferase class III-fold pyridoxal phosphate-dependent enzyme [Pseudomonas sp. BCA13]TFF26536.1 aminotransferase class III-fold pyridoxal phosphate-dependent enzyme